MVRTGFPSGRQKSSGAGAQCSHSSVGVVNAAELRFLNVWKRCFMPSSFYHNTKKTPKMKTQEEGQADRKSKCFPRLHSAQRTLVSRLPSSGRGQID